jgi:hypothetical protein
MELLGVGGIFTFVGVCVVISAILYWLAKVVK